MKRRHKWPDATLEPATVYFRIDPLVSGEGRRQDMLFDMNDPIKHYSDKLEFETDSWDLHDALSRGEKIVVIDARSPQSFQKEHIPGAVNIPHRTMTQVSTQHLDRANLYVVYCDGIGCNASTKGALNLARLGFRVKELMGGLDWWKRDGYKAEGSAATI